MQHLSVMMLTNQSCALSFQTSGRTSGDVSNARAEPSVAHISSMTAKFLHSSRRLAPTQHRNVLLVKVALNYLIKTQITTVNQNTRRTVSLQLIMTPAIKKLPSVFFVFFSFSRMLQCLLICFVLFTP